MLGLQLPLEFPHGPRRRPGLDKRTRGALPAQRPGAGEEVALHFHP